MTLQNDSMPEQTIVQVWQRAATQLEPIYGSFDQARQVAGWLLEKLLNINQMQLIINGQQELSAMQSEQLDNWLDQIIVQHQPYQYILGTVPFLDLEIIVQAPILIPRLETEWWVAQLLQQWMKYKLAPLKILDLCTGSGCIALALAKYFSNSQVWAVDLSPAACMLAEKNALHNQVSNINVVQSDLYSNLGDLKFDLIISNPPYIPAAAYADLDLSVRNWEDQMALVAPGDDLSCIRQIIVQAPYYLSSTDFNLPRLWLEIDDTQGDEVVDLMQQAGFNSVQKTCDQFGRTRVVVGR